MREVKAKVREWGRSLGIVLPKNVAEEETIRKDDTVTLLLVKKSNALEETFGTLRFKKPTTEMLKESDKESWDE